MWLVPFSSAFTGTWPTEGEERLAQLHAEAWDEATALPRAGPALNELAAMDHPLARFLSLLYAQRGATFERFGLSYSGPAVEALARQALSEPPISFATEGEPQEDSHWYALMALQLSATEDDIPLLLPRLSHRVEQLRSTALQVLEHVEDAEPGSWRRTGALPDLQRLADEDPSLALRCHALYALARRAFEDVEPALKAHAASGPGPLAWAAMVGLLMHDRAQYLAAATALLTKSRRGQGWEHWREELQHALETD